MYKKILLTSAFIYFSLLSLQTYAQISEASVPYSITNNLAPLYTFVEMPKFDKAPLIAEDDVEERAGTKAHRFAKMFNVGLHPYNSGKWDETDNGKVWRLGIRSNDASSIYLVFNTFKLNPGVKLFVYNPSFTSINGAFTSNNNNSFNVFSVAPILGDSLIVELNIPSELKDFGKLILTKVGHDYKNAFGGTGLKAKKPQSESCEIDINCPQGRDWQIEKRAVCKMIVGGYYCTGTLLNNPTTELIPYLLTAHHCVQTNEIAAEGVYFFNYENGACGASSETTPKTLNGAALLATTDYKVDFALLRLYLFPPQSYSPYMAGWDSRPVVPDGGICIHHPEGDVKKISFENDPLDTASYIDSKFNFDRGSFYHVVQWDAGATEPGSSGSPLFNKNHRIVSLLTAGSATCSDPKDDYFTRLSVAWSKYPKQENQLKAWLDPQNKGVTYLNGADPYVSVCDTFSNLTSKDNLTLFKKGFAWGCLSGHNSKGYSEFAEKYYASNTSAKIKAFYMKVGKAYSAQPYSYITLKIWEGSNIPEHEVYRKTVYLSRFTTGVTNFIGLDSTVVVAGSFFVGYSVNYQNPVDTFAVYQTFTRGINGPSTMYINDHGTWNKTDEITSQPFYSSLAIGIMACDSKVDIAQRKSVKVFPNPCSIMGNIDIPDGISIKAINCYDIWGKKYSLSYLIEEDKVVINTEHLPLGLYIVELITNSDPLITKFIVNSKK